MSLRLRAIALGIALPLAQAAAQLSGTVTDETTRLPVAGAVVSGLDSAGRSVARSATDSRGRFMLRGSNGVRRVRVIRLGFRPREVAVGRGATTISVSMARLPNLLEPVRTFEQPRCSKNPTRAAAFALWEQSKAALLGAVIAKESNAAEVTRLTFRRVMTPKGDEILRQSVRRETARSLRSFDAEYSASEFATLGFARPQSNGRLHFYGPDAEVLLDDAFPESYCLELARAASDRPRQVGLRFRPMQRQTGRVDIDGTLWVDTAALVVKDVDYAYLGLERWADLFHPGGRNEFREIAEGALWIDRWWIRMTGAGLDSGNSRWVPAYAVRAQLVEGGGELARVTWPDGRQWTASLGALSLTVVGPDGAALPDARVQLDSTDYSGVSDRAGSLAIPGLLPGPYTISVFDSTLAIVDTSIATGARFVASRDATARVTARVPSLTDFVGGACKARDSFAEGSRMLVARLVSKATGTPLSGAAWRLEDPTRADDRGRNWLAAGTTGADGRVFVCEGLSADQEVALRTWPPGAADGDPGTVVEVTMDRRVTALKATLPP
jgi:hypothetical protein